MNPIYYFLLISLVIQAAIFYKIYFQSYMKQKGENLATKEDIAEITKEIESAKIYFDLKSKTVNAALSSFTSINQVSDEKRLLAIQTMWEAIISYDTSSPIIFHFLDLFTKEEFEKLIETPRLKGAIEADLSGNARAKKTQEIGLPVDNLRPFLGEKLYQYFFAYRLFVGRMAWFQDEKEWANALNWLNDKHLKPYLDLFLVQKDWDELRNKKIGTILLVKTKMKLKMLSAIYHVITGKQSAEENVKYLNEFVGAEIEGLVYEGKEFNAIQ